MKKCIIAKKIPYGRDVNDWGITPCPHGGSVSMDDGFWKPGIVRPNAMVGSHACFDCEYFKDADFGYVKCNRKSSGVIYHFNVYNDLDGVWAQCVEYNGCATTAKDRSRLIPMCKDAVALFLNIPKYSFDVMLVDFPYGGTQ